MLWIATIGSVISAWSMLRLLGHERTRVIQNMQAEKLDREEANKPKPPTSPEAH